MSITLLHSSLFHNSRRVPPVTAPCKTPNDRPRREPFEYVYLHKMTRLVNLVDAGEEGWKPLGVALRQVGTNVLSCCNRRRVVNKVIPAMNHVAPASSKSIDSKHRPGGRSANDSRPANLDNTTVAGARLPGMPSKGNNAQHAPVSSVIDMGLCHAEEHLPWQDVPGATPGRGHSQQPLPLTIAGGTTQGAPGEGVGGNVDVLV